MQSDMFEKYSTTAATFTYTQAMYDKNYKLFINTTIDYVAISKEKAKELAIQLEQNSVATEYETYVKDKIFIKNDNDVYEEFEEEKKLEITTGVEFETNETRNGKVVYGKEIDCGKCPASSAKDVETGIDFSKAKLVDYSIILESNSSYMLLFKDIFRINIAKEWGTFQIYCDTNDYSNYDLKVTLYYTKD